MKIIVLANRENTGANNVEKRIDDALENIGYEVIKVDEKETTENILKHDADVLLFYKAGVERGVKKMGDLEDCLRRFKGSKVCIYFDKVWAGRGNYIRKIAPLTDLVYVSDGDFVRAHNYINLYELPQATCVDKRRSTGEKKDEYNIPIVFLGQVYGERANFTRNMLARYGNAFKVVNDVFDDNLTNLCESARVFVSPLYPQTDFYWSNRVYQIIGRGGFIIMPRLEGLTWEFKEGEHIEYYRSFEELCQKIDYYLEHEEERNKVRKAGQKHCLENYTYEKRLKEMLSLL